MVSACRFCNNLKRNVEFKTMEDAKGGVKKLKEDYLKEQEFHELKKHMCKVF